MDTISIQKASKISNVHWMTVYTWVNNGLVDAEKVNGKWQVNRTSLMKYACPDGLTVEQAALYMQIPKGTIYDLIKNKKIKSKLVRGKRIISELSLESYLSEHQAIEDNWITFQEAQLLSGVSRSGLRNWVREGKVKTKKFAGRRWFEKDCLEEFLSNRGRRN